MSKKAQKSAVKMELSFEPFGITAESLHTALLLLQSKESAVVCQTLRVITKFLSQNVSHREVLFNMDALKYIVPHVEHLETNIKRFALKALSELCQLPQGLKELLADEQILKKTLFVLTKCEDVFVHEFSSRIIAELTQEPEGCAQLVNASGVNCLFTRLRSSQDPDVQKNCLQTCYHLLITPKYFKEVTKHPQFTWALFLSFIFSRYLAIQRTALQIVDQLMTILREGNAETNFNSSACVLNLCDVLESYEFRDVHSETLSILRNYIDLEESASQAHASGCVTRLLTYLNIAVPEMKPQCLIILTKMSLTPDGRQSLYDTSIDLMFCEHLIHGTRDLYSDAAFGAANMTKLMPSAIRMADTKIIEALGVIIAEEQFPWYSIRFNALLAMTELCRIIPKAAFAVVEPDIFNSIRSIRGKAAVQRTPLEVQKLAMQCFISLLNFRTSRKAMTNQEFIEQSLDVMRHPDIGLKALSCRLLAGLMVEEEAKTHFFSSGGEQVVHTNLSIEHHELRIALCNLIASSVTDDGADEYLHLGTILYMIENKEARYTVRNWEPALEAIFHNHPSAKLAYCGRLDVNDFTAEGFYVMKRMDDYLMTMRDLMTSSLRHFEPVLIAMFFSSPLVDRSTTFDSRAHFKTSESNIALHSSSRLRFPPVQDDANLRTYLLQLKMLFGDPAQSLEYFKIGSFYEIRQREKCSEVTSTLKQRAGLLAEFVCDQMSGTSQERDCSLPSVELHLSDLVLSLGTRIVGLGWIKCGGALERAVLYKVLADRLGIPCSMHRSSSAHAWCEVAVPDVHPNVLLETPERYPAGLLRTNYVVDLMTSPGRLVPHGSLEARRVRGPPYLPMYVARGTPDGCKYQTVKWVM